MSRANNLGIGLETDAPLLSSPAPTPGATPDLTLDLTPRPSSASNLYGSTFIGIDEVMDVIDQVADMPGSRIGITRVDDRGQTLSIGSIPAANFDYDSLVARYGVGEYRCRIQVAGKRTPYRCFKFKAATPIGAAPSSAQQPQAAPVPQSSELSGQGLFMHALQMMQQANNLQQTMMMESMKSQATLMQTMMSQKTETRGVGELEAVLKLAERMAAHRESSEESGGIGGIIGQVLAGLMAARPAAAQHPRVTIRQPAAAPQPSQPEPHALAAGNARASERPAPAIQGDEVQPPAESQNPSEGQTGAQGGIANPPTPPAPEQSLASDVKSRLERMGQFLMWTCPSETRDAARTAESVADILGDDLAEQLTNVPAGVCVEQLIASNPALAAHREFLLEVETELRSIYSAERTAGQIGERKDGGR